MQKNEKILLVIVAVAVVATVLVDRLYLTGFKSEFNRLEKERIVTSNELASAKIVYENLNHVRDLVMQNIDFPNRKDSIGPETEFFNFLTGCANDLKMQIVSVRPLPAVVSGRVTGYGYDLELEGDFFKFGELCAKLESSRRLIAVENFTVTRNDAPAGSPTKVSMRVMTCRVRKGGGA